MKIHLISTDEFTILQKIILKEDPFGDSRRIHLFPEYLREIHFYDNGILHLHPEDIPERRFIWCPQQISFFPKRYFWKKTQLMSSEESIFLQKIYMVVFQDIYCSTDLCCWLKIFWTNFQINLRNNFLQKSKMVASPSILLHSESRKIFTKFSCFLIV